MPNEELIEHLRKYTGGESAYSAVQHPAGFMAKEVMEDGVRVMDEQGSNGMKTGEWPRDDAGKAQIRVDYGTKSDA